MLDFQRIAVHEVVGRVRRRHLNAHAVVSERVGEGDPSHGYGKAWRELQPGR
jgi:hypothetical protein